MNSLALLAENFALLFMESAPWLLLGLLIAGIMHELIPMGLLEKHMGSRRFSAVIKAAFIGAPLPLCSCGVIPAALGLRRSGASKPATVSFLIATPETGVDSVSVSYALLGPLYAIVRPIAAIFSALYAGILVKFFTEETPVAAAPEVKSCCASKTPEPKAESSCCSGQKAAPSKPSVTDKIATIWQFSSGKLLEDITKWLLIGLVLAAMIKTWIPTDFLTQWGDGFVAMLVMAIIGVPMYICATASTPIAAGFLAAGLSPGAVLVFLLAGPATNISTMGMIVKEMGRKTLFLYVFSVVTASIGLGYLLNILVDSLNLSSWINYAAGGHEHVESQAIYALCAVLLAGLMGRNGWRDLKQRFAKTESQSCCH